MRPFLPLLVAFVACSAQLQAQPGVRLGLIYGEGGARPGIFVLPVAGATGDSIRTIVMRDLDFGDRVTVLSKNTALPTPVGAAAVDFRAAARLGINGVVQITPAAGGVTITLHDVAAKQVLQRAVVILPGTPNTAAWRQAVHARMRARPALPGLCPPAQAPPPAHHRALGPDVRASEGCQPSDQAGTGQTRCPDGREGR